MPSSSNTRWTVNSNMTYKPQYKHWFIRLLPAAAFLVVCAFFMSRYTLQTFAAAQDALPGEADILLLYQEPVTEDQLDSLRILADDATALGMSMELGTPAQADGLYDHYKLILVYDMDTDAALAQQLTASGVRLMILGGTILPDCLEEAGISYRSTAALQSQHPSTSAVLTYEFTNQKSYQVITSLAELVYTSATNAEYESGVLDINGQSTPFCMGFDNIRYIPLTDYTQTLSHAAIANEISTWLWEYSGFPPQKGQYIVLNDVYAYMPATELLDRVDILVQSGLPFVISVMPVYINTDYPAMQQFCEVLRYAQANGGSIILHAPVARTAITDWDAYNATITEILNSYTSQNVYPLGFDVPYSWTWNEEALQWMQRSRTIFIYKDSAQNDFSLDMHQNLLFYNYNALVLPELKLDNSTGNFLPIFSSSHRIPAGSSLASLQDAVSAMQADASSYYSLWDNSQSVWANSFHLNWDGKALTLNDSICSLTYTPQSAEEDYDYNRNALQRFTVSIQNESHFLIILVSVVTIVFLLMIVYARHMQRRHFIPRNTTPEKNVSDGLTTDRISQHCEETKNSKGRDRK